MKSFSEQKALGARVKKARDAYFYYRDLYLTWGKEVDRVCMVLWYDKTMQYDNELNEYLDLPTEEEIYAESMSF